MSWIVLDKPLGISSNLANVIVRRLLRAKKAGYIGTLDKMASGILPIAIDSSTKLIHSFSGACKTYEFDMKFGIKTNTGDVEGSIEAVSDYIPTYNEIISALPLFFGDIAQTPHKFSAVHVNGRRAYDLARAGQSVDMTSKTKIVTVHNLQLLHYQPPVLRMIVDCSAGFYVRSLCEDIAVYLNSVAHVTYLRRTKLASFTLDQKSELYCLPFNSSFKLLKVLQSL